MTQLTQTSRDPRRQILEAFARSYGGTQVARSRFSMNIVPVGGERSFAVTALGVLPAKRELIVSAPRTVDGSLIAVYQGLMLRCGWFNASTLFRFEAAVEKVLFEPEPLLYLRLANHTWHRAVRTVPRALVNLPVELRIPQVETALLVDCSVTGARIALLKDTHLPAGQELELSFKPDLHLDIDLLLNMKCTVVGNPEPAPGHADIVFRGLKFQALAERDLLVLQAFVQQSLVEEMDNLAQVLLSARDLRELKE